MPFPALRAAASTCVLAAVVAMPAVAAAKAKHAPVVAKPDLTVSSIATPVTIGAGGTLTTSITVKDAGKGAAGKSVTTVVLSRDARRDAKDTVVQALGTKAVKAGKTSPVGAVSAVPSAATSGTWYLVACADSTAKLAEKNEKNNCAASKPFAIDRDAPAVSFLGWTLDPGGATFLGPNYLYFRTGSAFSVHAHFAASDVGLGIVGATTTYGVATALPDGSWDLAVTGPGVFSTMPQLTVRDGAGNVASASPPLRFNAASGSITSNSLSYVDTDLTTTSVPLTFSPGHNESGAHWKLQRSSASWDGVSCGTYGEYADTGPADPPSPYTDVVPGDGCYKYQLVTTTNVGTSETRTDSSHFTVELDDPGAPGMP